MPGPPAATGNSAAGGTSNRSANSSSAPIDGRARPRSTWETKPFVSGWPNSSWLRSADKRRQRIVAPSARANGVPGRVSKSIVILDLPTTGSLPCARPGRGARAGGPGTKGLGRAEKGALPCVTLSAVFARSWLAGSSRRSPPWRPWPQFSRTARGRSSPSSRAAASLSQRRCRSTGPSPSNQRGQSARKRTWPPDGSRWTSTSDDRDRRPIPVPSVEHDEVGRDRDRVRQAVPDGRGVLDVLAELLQLRRRRVRRLHPALRPDRGETRPGPLEPDEGPQVDVALDFVAKLADLDPAGRRVVGVPNAIAERQRLEEELHGIRARVRAEKDGRLVADEWKRRSPVRRRAGMDEVPNLAPAPAAVLPGAPGLERERGD